jgi:hypothetical protein
VKSITLRTLLREPLKVKRWTRTGTKVQVTDKGEPLWVLHPAATNVDGDDDERLRATNEILDEVLNEQPSKMSAVKLLEESRR